MLLACNLSDLNVSISVIVNLNFYKIQTFNFGTLVQLQGLWHTMFTEKYCTSDM